MALPLGETKSGPFKGSTMLDSTKKKYKSKIFDTHQVQIRKLSIEPAFLTI
jgi:hypothetical protein